MKDNIHFSLYLNDIHTLPHHIELAQYADDIALLAMHQQPALSLNYQKTCRAELEFGSKIEGLPLMLAECCHALHDQIHSYNSTTQVSWRRDLMSTKNQISRGTLHKRLTREHLIDLVR